ncbi:cadherin domain-containing protein [Sphingomonas parva]|uniref:cadherin domain-containing protein n=1 Tax=Sphingomonas parva TaxID=2555898 RepID=UPI0021F06029|nr:cadherin domain-containing protein [Sphingomonas parva]
MVDGQTIDLSRYQFSQGDLDRYYMGGGGVPGVLTGAAELYENMRILHINSETDRWFDALQTNARRQRAGQPPLPIANLPTADVLAILTRQGFLSLRSKPDTYDEAASGPWGSRIEHYSRRNRGLVDYDGNGKNKVFRDDQVQDIIIAAREQGFSEIFLQSVIRGVTTLDGGQLGLALGSVLGKQLTSDPFGQILASGTIGTVLGAVGEFIDKNVFHGTPSTHILDQGAKSFGTTLVGNIKGAGIGALSSYLTAELVRATGLNGLSAEVANSFGGAVVSQIITNITRLGEKFVVVENGVEVTKYRDLFTDIGPTMLASTAASFLGSKLASAIYTPDTVGGQIGAAVGSAYGSWVASTILASGLNPATFVAAIVVVAFWQLVGSVIGSLFGGTPRSGADAVWNEATQQFSVANVYSKKGGSKDAAKNVASAVAGNFNAVLAASGATLLDPGAVKTGNYGMRKKDFVYRPTSTRDTDAITARFSGSNGATNLVNHGSYIGLNSMIGQMAGGNIYVKRAIASSLANAGGNPNSLSAGAAGRFDMSTLLGDITVAREFEVYLESSLAISALMGASPGSAFAGGWLVTLARASELGINRRAYTDWIGGFNVFFDEVIDGSIDGNKVSAGQVLAGLDVETGMRQWAIFDAGGAFLGTSGDTIETGSQTVITATSGNDLIDLRGGRLADQRGYTVDGVLQNDIAVTGADFTGGSGTLAFASGQFRTSFTVATKADGVAEIDESFLANLTSRSGVMVVGDPARAVITESGLPTLLVGSSFATESDGFAVFRLSLSKAATQAIAVSLSLTDLTAIGGGVDFGTVGAPGLQVSTDGVTWVDSTTAQFAAGATELFVRTRIVSDDAVLDDGTRINEEASVRFELMATVTSGSSALSNGSAPIVGTGTIVSGVSDASLVWIDGIVVQEGGGATFVVSRNRATSVASVNYTVTDRRGVDISIAATVDGGAGADTIHGSDLGDNLIGGAGNDTLYGGRLDDWLLGGDGDDTIDAGSATAGTLGGDGNYLDGGAGNDILRGREGSDWLEGAEGTDQLFGGAGDDILAGGAGDGDQLQGGSGSDHYLVRFGDGVDTAQESGSTLSTGTTVDYIASRMNAIELWKRGLAGGLRADWAGRAAGVTQRKIDGGEDAVVFGAGITLGDIRLERSGTTATPGSDLIVTVVDSSSGTEVDSAQLILKDWFVDAFKRVEWLKFADGNQIKLGDITSFIVGGAGNDILIGTQNNDFIYGGAGNDSIRALAGNDIALGGTGDDLVSGDDDNDVVVGGLGNDQVLGGKGNDSLTGDQGIDEVFGGEGNDIVSGGLDSGDLVVGGKGDDKFKYARGDGHDAIFDDYNDAGWSVIYANGAYQTGYVIDARGSIVATSGEVIAYNKGTLDNLDLEWRSKVDWDAQTGTLRRFVVPTSGPISQDAGFDTLEFAPGINIQDIILYRSGNDLVLAVGDDEQEINGIGGVAGSVTIKDWYAAGLAGQIERLAFYQTGILDIQDVAGTIKRNLIAGSDSADGSTTQAMGGTSIDDWMTGGGGDDVIAGGFGNDIIAGNSGFDTLNGEAGDDVLFGGTGNDLLDGGAGKDVLIGGSGLDSASYRSATAAVRAHLLAPSANTGDAAGDEYDGIEGLVGGAGNDELGGDGGDNQLEGGAGNDLLLGNGGSDTYVWNAGHGADTIYDAVFAHSGTAITYDTGSDGGDDVLELGSAISLTDLVLVWSGNDLYLRHGGSTTQQIRLQGQALANSRIETLQLADGQAVSLASVLVAAGSAALSGSESADLLVGSGGSIAAILSGLGGDDVLVGYAGVDSLAGGSGDDILEGGAGGDTLDGGVNTAVGTSPTAGDTVRYVRSGAGVTVDLRSTGAQVGGDAAGDVLIGIENVTGSSFGDQLTGDDGGNRLIGLDGNDVLSGLAGDDVLLGDLGDDTLYGGDGIDALSGSDGNDRLEGGAGDDRLDGGEGVDTLLGDAGKDSLTGGAGDDTLDGGSENDSLYGDAGADILIGGDGDDSLVGGDGNDSLSGGLGIDTYGFGATSGSDTITDASGANLITFDQTVRHDQLWMTRVGNDLRIAVIGGTSAVTLTGFFTGGTVARAVQTTSHAYYLDNVDSRRLIDAMTAAGVTAPAEMPEAIAAQLAEFWHEGGKAAPTAPDTVRSFTMSEDGVLAVGGGYGVIDHDGGALTYSLKAGAEPSLGAISGLDPATGAFTYTPRANVSGDDAFSLLATDADGQAVELKIAVSVAAANDAPGAITIVGGGALSVAEAGAGSPTVAGTPVGSVTASDIDGDTLTFSLLDDAGGRFAISTGGAITVKTPALLNFEAAQSHTVAVRASDGKGGVSDATLAIAIGNFNERNTLPTGLAWTVAENSAAGTTLGTVAASDPDGAHAYGQQRYYFLNGSVASGTSADGRYAINPTSGVITTAAMLDFEVANPSASYTVIARDNAGAAPYNQAQTSVTLGIVNVNEANALPATHAFSLDENVSVGTLVGTVTATDKDSAGTAFGRQRYYFLNGTVASGTSADGRYTIDAATGQIKTATGISFEAGATGTYKVIARDNDGVAPYNQAASDVTIGVRDLNEANSLPAAQSMSIAENVAVGTQVGTVAASDPDLASGAFGQQRYYFLNGTATSGTSADGRYTIDALTGAVKTAAALNFEAPTPSASYTVVARDNAGVAPFNEAKTTLTIGITDVNEAPTAMSWSPATIAVDERDRVAAGTALDALALATFSVADPDTAGLASASYRYAVSDSRFEFVGNALRLKQGVALDYEAGASIALTVTATDLTATPLTISRSITITVGNRDDILDGTAAADTLTGQQNRDILTGFGGDDVLNGLDGADLLDGGLGNDSLFGGTGSDQLKGGDGDDLLSGGDGGDVLDGGLGNDTADYRFLVNGTAATAGVTVDLAAPASNLGTAAGDTFVSIENLVGTTLADTLRGDAGANKLYGLAGDDTLHGAAGNDHIEGGAGNDIIYGGDGDDVVLDGGDGNDIIYGGNGNDTLIGGAGNDQLFAENGDDLLDGGLGDDTLTGGLENDTYLMTRASGNDTIINFDPSGLDIDVIGLQDSAGAIADQDLWFERSGNDMLVSIVGANASARIKDWYITPGIDGANYKIDFIIAGNRVSKTINVEGLVALMAAKVKPTTAAARDGIMADLTYKAKWATYWGTNAKPVVQPIAAQTVNEGSPMMLTVTATDDITPAAGITLEIMHNGALLAPANYTLGAADALGRRTLTLLSPAGYSGDSTVSVTAIDAGGVRSDTVSFATSFKPVATTPQISGFSAAPGNAAQTGGIPLAINTTFPDNDGSEVHELWITGVPAGVTLSAGTYDTATATWKLTKAQAIGLAINTPAGWSQDLKLTLTARASEAGQTATATATTTVVVNAPPTSLVLRGQGTAATPSINEVTPTTTAAGTPVGVVAPVDPDALERNRIPTDFTLLPKRGTGEERIVTGTGPTGTSVQVLETGQFGAAGDPAGGGVFGVSAGTIDRTKVYKYTIYVKPENAMPHSLYFGTNGNVENATTGAADTNPYFWYGASNALVQDRWYRIEGYVLPAGSALTSADLYGGVFDTVTGAKIANTNLFRFAATATDTGARFFSFYGDGTAGYSAQWYQPSVEQQDYSFSLTDNAGGRFAIDPVTGLITAVGTAFNFEAAASHNVTVKVVDSNGAALSQVKTIGVTNVNEAPTQPAGGGSAYFDEAGLGARPGNIGTAVAGLTFSDPDAGDTARLEFTRNPGNWFAISGNQITFAAGLNFETLKAAGYSVGDFNADGRIEAFVGDVGVRTYDNGGLRSAETIVKVYIQDVNEAPVMATDTRYVYPNEWTGGAYTAPVIASYAPTDPDGTTPTLQFVANPGNWFSVSGSSVTMSSAINFEWARSAGYSVADVNGDGRLDAYLGAVVVRATDGVLTSGNATTHVYVSDMNDPVSLSQGSYSFGVNENQAVGTVVGQAVAWDDDSTAGAFGQHRFYFSNAGAASTTSSDGRYAINTTTGVITTAAALNYETMTTPTTYSVIVRDNQGVGAYYQASANVTVAVQNVNERPNNLVLEASNVFTATMGSETHAWSLQARFGLSDPDGATPALEIVSGNSNGWFQVNGNHIQVTSANFTTGWLSGTLGQYGQDAGYYYDTNGNGILEVRIATLGLRANDGLGGVSDTYSYNVYIEDRNEQNSMPGSYAFSVTENVGIGTAVGTVTASDPDPTARYRDQRYYFWDGVNASTVSSDGRMAIDAVSGAIRTNAGIDYEATRSLSYTVTARDNSGLAGYTQSFTTVSIAVGNVNDSPTYFEAIPVGAISVMENSLMPGQAIPGASVRARDADGPVSYRIAPTSNPNNMFSITSAGQITVGLNNIDFESTALLAGGTTGKYADLVVYAGDGGAEVATTVRIEVGNQRKYLWNNNVLNAAYHPESRSTYMPGGYLQAVGDGSGGTVTESSLGGDATEAQLGGDPTHIPIYGYDQWLNEWFLWGPEGLVGYYSEMSQWEGMTRNRPESSANYAPGYVTVGNWQVWSVYSDDENNQNTTWGGYPIGLDLDGDGLDLVGRIDSTAFFDMNGDGLRDRTSWVGAADALLAFDRDGDGRIAGLAEISFVGDKEGATTDLEGLAGFDDNGDGQLDARDSRFGEFLVWQDRNQDGVSQRDELRTLTEAGMASLSLAGAKTGQSLAGGDHAVLATASYRTLAGELRSLFDLVLGYLPAGPAPSAIPAPPAQEDGLAAPIIFDLDGDGQTIVALKDSATTFDMVGDGRLRKTAWADSGDAFLVRDRNGNGVVDGIGEISFVADKAGAKTDLEGLVAFDGNGDGVLDGDDASFVGFSAWVDGNANGRTDAGELLSLAQAGITSISLAGTATGKTAADRKNGESVIFNIAGFSRDGVNGRLSDVGLAFDTAALGPSAASFDWDSHAMGGRSGKFAVMASNGQLVVRPRKANGDFDPGAGAIGSAATLEFSDRSWGVFGAIVLDLDGDGVETRSLKKSDARFDADGAGGRDDIGWIGKGDGFLVIDRNGDGSIDREELSFLAESDLAETNLQGLSVLDANRDGKIDAADARFGELKVWADRNRDGITDEGELLTLAEANIKTIGLAAAAAQSQAYKLGSNVVLATASFTRTDGETRSFAETAFAFRPSEGHGSAASLAADDGMGSLADRLRTVRMVEAMNAFGVNGASETSRLSRSELPEYAFHA